MEGGREESVEGREGEREEVVGSGTKRRGGRRYHVKKNEMMMWFFSCT